MKRSPFVEFPQLQRLMWSAFLHFLLGVFNLTCRSGRCCNDHRTEILGNPILSTSFIGFLMVIHNTRVMVSTQIKNMCQIKPFPAFGNQNASFWNHHVVNSLAYLLYLEVQRRLPLWLFPSQIFLGLIFANSVKIHMQSKPETHLAIKQVLDI